MQIKMFKQNYFIMRHFKTSGEQQWQERLVI